MNTTRKLMAIYFVWLLLEGAVRKWLFPDFASQIFVVKDILLWGMFIHSMNMLTSQTHTRPAFEVTILSVVFFVALFLVTPFSSASVIGLRYYLSSLPLLVLIPYLIDDIDDLETVGKWILMSALPLLLLAVIQYASPPESEINRYVGSSTAPDVAVFGVESTDSQFVAPNRARVTSTFSYISPYGAYLQTLSVLVWVLLLVSRNRQSAIAVMVTLVLASMAFTGARGAAGFGLVVSAVFLGFGIRCGALRKIGIGIAIGGALLLALSPWFLGEAFDLFMARTTQSDDFLERFIAFAVAPFVTLVDAGFMGTGMGSTLAGVGEILGTNADAGYSEIDHDRVGIELGVLAYLMIFSFKLALLSLTLELFFREEDLIVKTWVLGSFMVQILSGLVVPFHNTIANAAYMGAVGLYFWLREWTLAQNDLRAESESQESAESGSDENSKT